MQHLHDAGRKVGSESHSSSSHTTIKALALFLFLIGLFLPFLSSRAGSPEFMPSERLGYELLLKGTVQNIRNIARRALKSAPLPLKGHRRLIGTSAILCLPISLVAMRKRYLWAACLSGLAMTGVVWLLIDETRSFFLPYIGPGFISWFLSAALATVLCIRKTCTNHSQPSQSTERSGLAGQ